MENKTPLCKQFWLIFEGINKEKSLRYKYKLTENKAIETTGSGKVYKIVDNKVYYKFRDGTPEETARLAATAAEQAVQDATAISTNASSDNTDKKKKK